ENADAFALLPAIDRVARHVGEEQVTTVRRQRGERRLARLDPNGSFRPIKARRELLQRGRQLDQSEKLRIDHFQGTERLALMVADFRGQRGWWGRSRAAADGDEQGGDAEQKRAGNAQAQDVHGDGGFCSNLWARDAGWRKKGRR